MVNANCYRPGMKDNPHIVAKETIVSRTGNYAV